jgi:hypothetical protein
VIPGAGAGPVAAYGFGEGSGTAVGDSSGNGNAGTAANASWTTGHTGGALAFNGTSTRVNVPDSSSLDLTTALTLEAWVKPSALNGKWRTVLVKTAGDHLAYALYAAEQNGRPSGHPNTGADPFVGGPSALPLNAWTHLATTWDGQVARLFVNGNLVATKSVTGTIAASGGELQIGGNSIWGEWFAGAIDDVRIYDRALTGAEVRADMSTAVG